MSVYLKEALLLSIPYVPVGFLLGSVSMLFGIGVQVITNIFKKI